MRRLVGTLLMLTVILTALSALACKERSTTILNKEATIYYGDSQIEATARELTVDGGRTSVRIRFVNLSGVSLESLKAHVDFVDAHGGVIASDEIELTFTEPLTVGDSVSGTAYCESNRRIRSVLISSAEAVG